MIPFFCCCLAPKLRLHKFRMFATLIFFFLLKHSKKKYARKKDRKMFYNHSNSSSSKIDHHFGALNTSMHPRHQQFHHPLLKLFFFKTTELLADNQLLRCPNIFFFLTTMCVSLITQPQILFPSLFSIFFYHALFVFHHTVNQPTPT